MSYSNTIKEQAASLRRKGHSLIQIGRELNIAKSTISLWVRNIILPKEAQINLNQRSIKGRTKALEILSAKRNFVKLQYYQEAEKIIKNVVHSKDKNFWRLITSVIFWCEGSKRRLSSLYFTNSDPQLISLFIHGLRNSFPIEEKRFRAMLHIHEYHNEKKQMQFWSKVTGIPLSQFHKSYLKPHTGIRARENYQGCLSLRYYDARIARQLDALYHVLAEYLGA